MAKTFLTGNTAFGHAALAAGVRVAAGYPGTPSSEVIETIAKQHASGAARGVHVEWSTNEKAALELLAGAAYAGARTLYTCKQVGLNVASDALMSLNYVGVKGGTVLFVADDPGPISSQTEQDTRRFAAFAKVPVLDPATPEQGCEMIAQAYELSERYHTPVIVRPTTRICHASTFFEVPETTQAREAEGFEKDPKWVIFPRRAYQAHGEINARLAAMANDFAEDQAFARFNPIETLGEGAPRVGVVAGGVSYAYAREAFALLADAAAREGVELPAVRFWQVGTPYPFPEGVAAEFAQDLDDVIVFEELDTVLEDALLAFAGRTHASFDVHGKYTGEATDRGENTVEDIARRIGSFLDVTVGSLAAATFEAPRSAAQPSASCASLLQSDEKEFSVQRAPQASAVSEPSTCSKAGEPGSFATLAEKACGPKVDAKLQGELADLLAPRPPVLCPGCPHRGAFYAVKKAVGRPKQARFCGDIGCYTLGNAKPLDAVDTCLCMGAGITIAQGFATVEPGVKSIAFIGDSTFFASGMTGVANAVYNQHDITICILDNATTAMTGSQPHPGTGVTLMGPKSTPIDIEAVLRALGVTVITHANPLFLDDSIAAAKEAIDFEGPSAIIFQSPCISLLPPDEPVVFEEDACTGCTACVSQIGCPALSWDADAGHPRVDESLCCGCGLCVDLCAFGALTCSARDNAAPDHTRFKKPGSTCEIVDLRIHGKEETR